MSVLASPLTLTTCHFASCYTFPPFAADIGHAFCPLNLLIITYCISPHTVSLPLWPRCMHSTTCIYHLPAPALPPTYSPLSHRYVHIYVGQSRTVPAAPGVSHRITSLCPHVPTCLWDEHTPRAILVPPHHTVHSFLLSRTLSHLLG